MKLKSFLFLIAALAVGLAFASCGGDDGGGGGTGTDYYWGFSSDIEAINEAFTAGAVTVYLTRDVSFSNAGEILQIPPKKTLDLKGYKLTDSAGGYLVVEGTLKWDPDNTRPIELESSYIVAKKDYITSNVGTLSDTTTKDRPIIVYGGSLLAAGSAVAAGGTIESGAALFALTAAELNDNTKPGNLGALAKPGFILGDFAPASAIAYTGGGLGLIVTGDLTLSGTISGGGTVTVIGKVTDKVGSTAAGANPIVAGTLTAANIESKGGMFNILTLKSPVKTSNFGTDNVVIGTLSAAGPVTFEKDVAGTIIAENVTFNGKVNAYPTSKVNRVTFGGGATIIGNGLEGTIATLKGALNIGSATVGGTFTVSQPLTLGSGQSIVLGANGGFKLVSTGKLAGGNNYEVTGAGGSLLNDATNAGTTVTLGASGITATGNGYIPNIVFGGVANLIYKADAEISGFNLNVKDGGSISVNGGNKMLTITGGGSITAANTEGTLSTASLYVITNATGSLVVGTYGVDSGGSVGAGSYGTFAEDKNFIHGDIYILNSGTSSNFGLTNATHAVDGDSAAGSLVVFKEKN
ncbi:MAG: hypothetical protein LBJ86_04950 [Spirochaetaceae bacterium]|jgi:hypothetical protein|nr:hypothetical protein [Spirochaetaceae bacterium]